MTFAVIYDNWRLADGIGKPRLRVLGQLRIDGTYKKMESEIVTDTGETGCFMPVRIAILTVSDTRNLQQDRSGNVLAERIVNAGHVLAERMMLPDERDLIANQLRIWIGDLSIDVIVTTGGTGLTGRDVTVEAHRDVYEKEIDAFSTVFTMVSMKKIGTSAVQSRATGGVAGGTYLFALPGSPGACRDAWDEILVNQLDYRHKPCNFVEIMPRLDEHLRRK